MPVLSTQIVPLTLDEVPKEMRPWVEAALVLPLNRLMESIRVLLANGISLGANVNAQVLDLRFVAPAAEVGDWSSHRFDSPLTLSGPATGVQVLGAWTLDAAGHDSAAAGSLPSPTWREVVVGGKRSLRLVFQSGLSEAVKYRISYLVWGA